MPDGQPPYEYTRARLQHLLAVVSQDRIMPYYKAIRRTTDQYERLQKAFGLYEKNTSYSEAMYPILQGFEISMRNRIHDRLTKDHGAGWYDKIELLPLEKDKVAQARKEIADKIQVETASRIVGELSFAFWVRLFSTDYEGLTWQPSLRHLVPNKLTRGEVYARFKDIKTLRNRIAHHSRIIDRSVTIRVSYEQIMESIGWFSADMQAWVKATSRTDSVLPKPIFNRAAAVLAAPSVPISDPPESKSPA
jgi:Abi-like protein